MPQPTAVSRTDPAADLPLHVQKLAALGVQRRYRTHSLLIEEGDEGNAVYVVISGRLRAFVSDSRGREVTLAMHGPGDYVGEMSLDGGTVECVSALPHLQRRQAQRLHAILLPVEARQLATIPGEPLANPQTSQWLFSPEPLRERVGVRLADRIDQLVEPRTGEQRVGHASTLR